MKKTEKEKGIENVKEEKRTRGKNVGTILGQENLRNIFLHRTNVLKGLTKEETVSDYFKISLENVLSWDKKKFDSSWEKIQKVRHILRHEKIIAIVCLLMPKGTILSDKKWGKRRLGQQQYVYFSCTNIDVARSVRDMMDKIAKGIVQVGEDVVEIVETENEKQEVFETIETVITR